MKSIRRQNLEAELEKVRADVTRLEEEIAKVLEAEQHEEVEHLEEYFDAVETRFRGLRAFWQSLFEKPGA
ncbi:hypothetical protein [Roseibacillus ishigakijimensis]|uniref:Uncharacterized protein n=1 Tax=Roseibacillus ishigakijimensis TaxID=454146 RepID=A0A934RP43_9BACT|nr:hypothetical protein [Roseibacillus ishigakijimensis]MBK1834383.1 hypothetical protein [Roseibacillus ishigakijimensis]